MPEEKTTDQLLSQPITPGFLLEGAIAKTDLPPKGDLDWDAWLEQFTDAELTRRLELAIAAAIKSDTNELEHWMHQSEDQYHRLKATGGKV